MASAPISCASRPPWAPGSASPTRRPSPRASSRVACSTRCARCSSACRRAPARGRVRGPPLGGPGVARPDRVPRAEPRLARRDRAHVPQRRAASPPPAAAVDRRALAGAPVEVLELGRLGRAEVAVQAEAILGRPPEPALVDELVQRAGGNAFITEELLASLDRRADARGNGRHAGAPRPCRTLPDDARVVVEAMSVAGVGVDEDTVASVIAVPELDVESALRSALDAQVIVGRGERLRVPSRPVAGGGLRRPAAERAPPLSPGLRPVAAGGPSSQAPTRARHDWRRLPTMRWPPTTCRWRCAPPSPPARRPWRPAHSSTRRGTSSGLSSSSTRSRTPGASWTAGGPVLRLAAEAANFSTDPARAVRLWEEAIAAAGPEAPPAERAGSCWAWPFAPTTPS